MSPRPPPKIAADFAARARADATWARANLELNERQATMLARYEAYAQDGNKVACVIVGALRIKWAKEQGKEAQERNARGVA